MGTDQVETANGTYNWNKLDEVMNRDRDVRHAFQFVFREPHRLVRIGEQLQTVFRNCRRLLGSSIPTQDETRYDNG